MATNSPRRSGGSTSAVKADAKASAANVKADAKAKAADLKDDLKDKASNLKDQAQSEVEDRVQQGKSKAAGVLGDVSDALHETGDSLRENDRDAFADYADTAADQLDQFVNGVRDRSVGELFDEAERFARQDPGLFVGGAFLLGIFGARFFKASASGDGGSADRSSGSGMTRGARRDDWRMPGAGAAAGRTYTQPPSRSSTL